MSPSSPTCSPTTCPLLLMPCAVPLLVSNLTSVYSDCATTSRSGSVTASASTMAMMFRVLRIIVDSVMLGPMESEKTSRESRMSILERGAAWSTAPWRPAGARRSTTRSP